MRIRSGILVVVFAATAAACGGARAGRIMADTPALPYQAPDADEIAGIEPEPESEATTPPAPASTPAQKPQR